jgi:hypothetical protein
VPEERAGYLVFFDPQRGAFGLGTYGKDDVPIYIGTYGTFMQTLVGM